MTQLINSIHTNPVRPLYCPRCHESTPVIYRRRLNVLALVILGGLMPFIGGLFLFLYSYDHILAFSVPVSCILILYSSEARACGKCKRFERSLIDRQLEK